jgi:hypothetical protein
MTCVEPGRYQENTGQSIPSKVQTLLFPLARHPVRSEAQARVGSLVMLATPTKKFATFRTRVVGGITSAGITSAILRLRQSRPGYTPTVQRSWT